MSDDVRRAFVEQLERFDFELAEPFAPPNDVHWLVWLAVIRAFYDLTPAQRRYFSSHLARYPCIKVASFDWDDEKTLRHFMRSVINRKIEIKKKQT